jgi:hypothetical protein
MKSMFKNRLSKLEPKDSYNKIIVFTVVPEAAANRKEFA